jgi:hypothetical protein
LRIRLFKRAILILTAVVLATAAPLRAWCEADCLAPATHEASSTSHCQTTEPDADTTSLSASLNADCPVIETARAAAAKIEFVRATPAATWHLPSLHLGNFAPHHSSTATHQHLTRPPLRI